MGHALPILQLVQAWRCIPVAQPPGGPPRTGRNTDLPPPELFWFGTTHRKIIYSFSVQIAEVRGVVSSAIKVDQIIKTCIPNPAFRLLSKQSAPKARPDNWMKHRIFLQRFLSSNWFDCRLYFFLKRWGALYRRHRFCASSWCFQQSRSRRATTLQKMTMNQSTLRQGAVCWGRATPCQNWIFVSWFIILLSKSHA